MDKSSGPLYFRFQFNISAPAPFSVLFSNCVDWTEHRFHLGGKLGAWLTTRLFEREWLRRRTSTRALTATTVGHKGFSALGLEWEEL